MMQSVSSLERRYEASDHNLVPPPITIGIWYLQLWLMMAERWQALIAQMTGRVVTGESGGDVKATLHRLKST